MELRSTCVNVFAVCFWLGLATIPLAAQTRSVTLAWDPSPDPSAIGYVVYVGSVPGFPDESYDVSGTSFVYRDVEPNRAYFFSVAAYAAGHRVGDRSDEVFFLAGATLSETSLATRAPVASAPTITPAIQTAQSRICLDAASQNCYVVDLRIAEAGTVSAIAAVDDGRVLFVENDVRVRIIANDALVPTPALTAPDTRTRFSGVAIDPNFSRTRFVYVAETETMADAGRQLSVVRYRELQGSLGEPAVIVSGLRLPSTGDPVLALDTANHLYIAVPAAGGDRPDIYDGMVLRFNTDGTVPSDNRAASPILARGYSRPAALQWDGIGNELWVIGSDSDRSSALGRIQLGRESAEWPRAPTEDPAFATADGARTVVVVRHLSSGELEASPLPGRLEGLDGECMAATAEYHGGLYLVMRVTDSDSTMPRSQVIRLRRP